MPRSRSRTTSSARPTTAPASGSRDRRAPRQPAVARRDAAAGTAFARLTEIMRTLRSRYGCPWDIKQTHDTLRPFLLEESYEALDAIDRADSEALAGELGDVLLQCVFHAQIAVEHGHFSITQVVSAVSDKLIRRHPHVFRTDGTPLSAAERRARRLDTPEQVKEQWERLKAGERVEAGRDATILSGLPRALPALLRASKIGARVAMVGFDWPAVSGVLDKIDEEVRELRAAVEAGPDALEDEMGDVLFSIANLARKLDVDPERALSRANDKFTERFARLEAFLARQGLTVHTATPAEMDLAWTAIKKATPTPARATTSRTRSAPGSRRRRSRP